MCVTLRRQDFGVDVDAGSAAAFAGAAVISALGVADWQISQDVEAAMASAVDALDAPIDRVEVTLHHDWVDVTASAGQVSSQRRCFPRRPFRTSIDCHQNALPDRVDNDVPRPPATSNA